MFDDASVPTRRGFVRGVEHAARPRRSRRQRHGDLENDAGRIVLNELDTATLTKAH